MNAITNANTVSLLFTVIKSKLVRLLAVVVVSLLIPVALISATTENEGNESKGEFLGAMPTVYPDWFKTSFLELEEDVAEAAEAGKRLMLVFHQDGCPYCNIFVERNLAQKDIEERLKKDFDVLEINMWGDREVASVDGQTFTEKTFASALKVQFTPTVLFLDEQGKLALRINGYYQPDKFRLALDYVTGKMETKLSFNEFIAGNESNASPDTLTPYSYYTGTSDKIHSRDKSRPMILVFEQSNCANCDSLHQEVLAQKESQDLLEQFEVFQIDLWGKKEFKDADGNQTTGRELGKKLKINYAPTLVLYSADQQEVIRSEAWLRKFHTQSLFDYVLSDAWQEQPNFQRYLSSRAEQLQEEGKDVNIFD